MKKKLNLLEILKDVPNGTKLYSPICGELEFDGIEPMHGLYPICCHKGEDCFFFTKEGKYYPYGNEAAVLLFPSKDNRDWSAFKIRKKSVIERIKTFKDALNELGEKHPYVIAYNAIMDVDFTCAEDYKRNRDIIAYIRLRIIAAALNEGWEPQFVKSEKRYYPWFVLLAKNEYDSLDDDEKECCVVRSGNSLYSYFRFVYVYANYDSAFSNGNFGARLAFKTRELAEYAGKQFIDIWVDYLWK